MVAGSIPGEITDLILSAALWPWDRVPGIFLGVKGGRPASKASNLTGDLPTRIHGVTSQKTAIVTLLMCADYAMY
jgi:hypothetical protein